MGFEVARFTFGEEYEYTEYILEKDLSSLITRGCACIIHTKLCSRKNCLL